MPATLLLRAVIKSQAQHPAPCTVNSIISQVTSPGMRVVTNIDGLRKLYLKIKSQLKNLLAFSGMKSVILSFYLSEWEFPQLSRPVVGGEPPFCSPGTSHEEARLQDGARTVHLHPMPSHIPVGMAPLHSHLCSPRGLLQRAHPSLRRLDKGAVEGLWGRERGPQWAQ